MKDHTITDGEKKMNVTSLFFYSRLHAIVERNLPATVERNLPVTVERNLIRAVERNIARGVRSERKMHAYGYLSPTFITHPNPDSLHRRSTRMLKNGELVRREM